MEGMGFPYLDGTEQGSKALLNKKLMGRIKSKYTNLRKTPYDLNLVIRSCNAAVVRQLYFFSFLFSTSSDILVLTD